MRQVEIPSNYFYDMSKKDYSHFETALVREFFQNSYDAGAKNFWIDYDIDNLTLTISDDGCGMDDNIILTKLLVMGESHKDSPDAVGAFGHAKILLYFSWPKWEIRTKNYKVTGRSHFYEIEEVDDYVHGTVSTIHLPEKDCLSSFEHYARSYFEKCETGCTVRFKTTEESSYSTLSQSVLKTEKIYDSDNYDIFKTTSKGWYIIVRQRGVFMFTQFISGNSDTQAVVELKKRPEELLLQNRDYFKSGVADEFDKIKREFAVDSVETFAINHDTNKNNFITVQVEDDSMVNNIEAEPVSKIITYSMDSKKAKKETKRLRSKRIINICYAYADMITKRFRLQRSIVFGFTDKGNQAGMYRYNSDNNENEIYINLDNVTRFSPNYRKMSVILLNVVKHEMAHAYNHEQDGSSGHDESFVRILEDMHDTFWDTVIFTKKFKEVWKATTNEKS